MKGIKLFLCIALALIVILQSCKKEESKEVVIVGYKISKDSLQFHLKNLSNPTFQHFCKDKLTFLDTLQTIYKGRKYKPFWWEVLTGDSLANEEIKALFYHSNFHGMDYRYYCLPLINYYKTQVGNFKTSDSAYTLLIELEYVLSNYVLEMYENIANGRTNPKNVYGYTYMLPRNNYKRLDYEKYLTSSNKIELIDKIHAEDTTYQELLKVMDYYINKQAEERQTAIDFSEHPKLELGDTTPVISQIIQRLKQKNLPDEEIQAVQDTNIYTRELQTQIKKLQEKYNLTPDGIMGFKTYKVINATPSKNIDQVKANLERQRWFTKPQERPFVYVNLPQYIVDLNWPDSSKSMKVCIGKNLPDNYDAMVKQYTDSGWLYKLPRNMETPQIASRITYLVMNPTWTVPYSIIKNEMWWRMVKDPQYLNAKGFRVYRGKVEVQSDTIQWHKINRNRIPYRIVENPGPKNSLGTVKYMFHNPFSIYLHDTPNKSAFKRTQRAVSHGCVRLENPILFGEFLMQNSKEYDSDDFRVMMGYPPLDKERLEDYDPADTTAILQKLEETTKLPLDKSMPLYLDYRTVYFDSEWKLHFCYDIYDQNKLILKEMNTL